MPLEDVISYRAVNIPPDRILIVDPTGVVKRADAIGFVSSYHLMAMDTVDFLFPPLMRNVIANSPSKTGNLAKLHTQFTKPQRFR
jgi:phosphatidate phosphatase PAH1